MADIDIGLNTEAFRHADKTLEYSLEAIRKQGYRYCELNMLNGRSSRPVGLERAFESLLSVFRRLHRHCFATPASPPGKKQNLLPRDLL